MTTEQWNNLERSKENNSREQQRKLRPKTVIRRNAENGNGKRKASISLDRNQTIQHESLILAQDERWRRA